MRAAHFIVSGGVQGVGFRAATRDAARRLNLAGWVRNRADGTVEVMACGNDTTLNELHDWLAQGPPAAVVDDVVSATTDNAESLPDPFGIR